MTTAAAAYRPHLDGIRAVAVVLVILFHLGYAWIPGGFIGVDVFFVLSGYLITGLLVDELPATAASISRASTPAACAGCCPRRCSSWPS